LTAGDGPFDTTFVVGGRMRQFFTYRARGAAADGIEDDGTIAPTAAGGSVAFAPELSIPALIAMREKYGDNLFGTYGFVDDFNPTLVSGQSKYGRIVPGVGWFDTDYLGIDQGPIVAMMALTDEMVDQLYVAPGWTAQGIGSRLIGLAQSRRPNGLDLYTFQVNRGARRFYERHGFVEVASSDGSENEERQPDVRYAWRPVAADSIR